MGDDDLDRTIQSGQRQAPVPGNLMARKPDPMLGTVFADRYTILSVLGRGGMGVVYKARHDLMDRLVAIKMMLPQLVCDEVSLARFQREARAASKINHPNVIAIHDFGMTQDTGIAYLVMDYIDGQTLSDAIKSDGQLDADRAARIFLQVCDALEHAHKTGIIHRDLKPGNIMLVTQLKQADFVKILDFGVAKLASSENDTDQQRLTTTGEIFGSPIYMSPEQCSGNQLDARSDIYSLGCVMYETLTGKPPCVGKNALETISRHISMAPPSFKEARPDLDIPQWLQAVVFKALQKSAEKRQQSMQEMFDEFYQGLGAANSATQMKQIVSVLRSSELAKPQPKDRLVISSSQRTTRGDTTRVEQKAQRGQSKTVWPLLTAAIVLAIVAGGGALAWFIQTSNNPSTSGRITPSPPAVKTASGKTQTIPLQQTSPPLPPADRTTSAVPPAPTQPPAPASNPSALGSATAQSSTSSHAQVVVHHEQASDAYKESAHTSAHKIKKAPAESDTIAPSPVRHHHSSDYYDYAVQHENEGAPTQLPGKLFGN